MAERKPCAMPIAVVCGRARRRIRISKRFERITQNCHIPFLTKKIQSAIA